MFSIGDKPAYNPTLQISYNIRPLAGATLAAKKSAAAVVEASLISDLQTEGLSSVGAIGAIVTNPVTFDRNITLTPDVRGGTGLNATEDAVRARFALAGIRDFTIAHV